MSANVLSMHGNRLLTEKRLQGMIEQWFTRIGLPHLAQCRLANCNRVDLMLGLSQDKPDPWCVLELKPVLDIRTTSVKDLAGHFEQCVKYHFQTGLPVFLGPFFIPTLAASEFFQGGAQPRHATATFSAYAGRLNIGLFFICATPGHEDDPLHWNGFMLTLRQQTVAQWGEPHCVCNHKWPTEPILLVDYRGAASKTVRCAS